MSLTSFVSKVRRELFIRRSRRTLLNVSRILQGNYTPKEKLEFAHKAVSELRKGQDNTDTKESIGEINEALEAGWSYGKIGISAEELIEFRNGKSQKIFAARTLEELRVGTSFSTYEIRELIKEGGFSFDELGTSGEELDLIDRSCELQTIKRKVEKLKATASENFEEARKELMQSRFYFNDPEYFFGPFAGNGNGKFIFTPEELGLTREHCLTLFRRAYLNSAKLELEKIRDASAKGCLPDPREVTSYKDENSMTHIDRLKFILQKTQASLEEIGSSEEDLCQILKNGNIQHAKNILEDLRNPTEKKYFFFGLISEVVEDHEFVIQAPVSKINMILRDLRKAGSSLDEIETNNEEIKILCKKGHLFVAKLMIEKLRLIESGNIVLDPEEDKLVSVLVEKVVRESLKLANKTLDDIGSSEDELNNLIFALSSKTANFTTSAT